MRLLSDLENGDEDQLFVTHPKVATSKQHRQAAVKKRILEPFESHRRIFDFQLEGTLAKLNSRVQSDLTNGQANGAERKNSSMPAWIPRVSFAVTGRQSCQNRSCVGKQENVKSRACFVSDSGIIDTLICVFVVSDPSFF